MRIELTDSEDANSVQQRNLYQGEPYTLSLNKAEVSIKLEIDPNQSFSGNVEYKDLGSERHEIPVSTFSIPFALAKSDYRGVNPNRGMSVTTNEDEEGEVLNLHKELPDDLNTQEFLEYFLQNNNAVKAKVIRTVANELPGIRGYLTIDSLAYTGKRRNPGQVSKVETDLNFWNERLDRATTLTLGDRVDLLDATRTQR